MPDSACIFASKSFNNSCLEALSLENLVFFLKSVDATVKKFCLQLAILNAISCYNPVRQELTDGQTRSKAHDSRTKGTLYEKGWSV